MKVLVTGANGFIGRHWIESLLRQGCTVIATGTGRSKPDEGLPCMYRSLDITDASAVREVIRSERPQAILHAAAISKPDVCESDPELADRVNVRATKYLLEESSECGAYFCFISTDFVFDGVKGMYSETDVPCPINHYGHTKWEAEQFVASYPFSWSIARTVSVYGQPVPGRANILSVVVDKLSRGESHSVVDDQIRTPTYAGDLARGVCDLICGGHTGVFHLSGEEVMTPYQMAIRAATHVGLDPTRIERVTSETFVQPAKRPLRTGFNIQKAKETIRFSPLSFEEGLKLSFPSA